MATLRASIRVVRQRNTIPRRAALTLTRAAVDKVMELMNNNPAMAALRIGVRARGCNGLQYTLEYADTKKKFDEEVSQDGVKIYIDSKAQLTILGTEMDYTSNILDSGFVFNNPNITGTCGCGESFSVK
ncbi:Iron-sulfur cluster assembly 1-like protein, mitochondrial [Trichoplax sp. H2]|nr:Iron-sulfur cluster assembly 1-like protein, mitochondrial [Trichoplax sp. H2]|eukprot:RDD47724.1 Iron-sulfur cluster assembly 1-like protein, mitochondrial [Trichoplax sp. H2]